MNYKVIINRPGQKAKVVRNIARAQALALVDHVLRHNTEAAVTVVRG